METSWVKLWLLTAVAGPVLYMVRSGHRTMSWIQDHHFQLELWVSRLTLRAVRDWRYHSLRRRRIPWLRPSAFLRPYGQDLTLLHNSKYLAQTVSDLA